MDALDDERQSSPAGLGDPDRVELWLDDTDTDTIGEGQEDSLRFSDESDLDDDIWVSDKAESVRATSPLLEYLDDHWDSSQSTLDVRDLPNVPTLLFIRMYLQDLAWGDEEVSLTYSQSSVTSTAFSDPSPRDILPTDLLLDAKEVEQLGDLLQTDRSRTSQHSGLVLSEKDDQALVDLRHDDSLMAFDDLDMLVYLDSGSLSPAFDDSADEAMPYFSILTDDDLEAAPGSRALNASASELGAGADTEDTPGSSDGKHVSHDPNNLRPGTPLQPWGAAGSPASLRAMRGSVSAHQAIDRWGGGGDWAHEGNEGCLVAHDSGHAMMIRPWGKADGSAGADGEESESDGEDAEARDMLFIE